MTTAHTINAQATHRISFIGIPPGTYNVLGFGNQLGVMNYQVLPIGTGLPIPVFVAQNPQFWIELDSDGNQQLCTTKTLSTTTFFGSFATTVGGAPRGQTAHPFELVFNEQSGSSNYMPKSQD